MNYTLIEKPPENVDHYVLAPRNDIREEFVRNLVGLLRQDVFHIRTDVIPLGWATDAAEEAKPKQYRMMMLQTPVNWGEPGTAYGIFYFKRQPSN